MTVKNTQGQLPAEKKDRNHNLFGLTLTKEELGAVRLAMQLDYESLMELQSHDTDWGHQQSVAGSVLYKIRLLDGAAGFKETSQDSDCE